MKTDSFAHFDSKSQKFKRNKKIKEKSIYLVKWMRKYGKTKILVHNRIIVQATSFNKAISETRKHLGNDYRLKSDKLIITPLPLNNYPIWEIS